jgi:isocitrate dehydrogenase (NAD+)
MHEKIPF